MRSPVAAGLLAKNDNAVYLNAGIAPKLTAPSVSSHFADRV